MKTLLALLFAAVALVTARGATLAVNSDPTAEEITLLSTLERSWHVHLESGDLTFFPEFFLTTSSGTVSAQHDNWQETEQIGIVYDEAGNLTTWVGDTQLVGQPTLPFNTIIIRIGDRSVFGPTRYEGGLVNGTSIGNMFADDNNSFIDAYDWIVISVDEMEDFSSVGNYIRNPFTGNDESQIDIFAVSVPEPSSLVLTLPGIFFLVVRRKRPTRKGGPFHLVWCKDTTAISSYRCSSRVCGALCNGSF